MSAPGSWGGKVTQVFIILRLFFEVLTVAILARAILSWFVTRPNTLTLLLDRIVEPVLAPLRRFIPTAGGFDFTPLIAILILRVLVRLIS